MSGKLFDPHLDMLERRFQALRDQIGTMPEAYRPGLEGVLQELSQAIAALRADREAGESLRLDPPGGREAQGSQGGESLSPMDPEAWPSPWEAMLRHVFNAIPDMLNVIDRDFNIIMSNWRDFGMVPEEGRRGRPKCYQVYHHRERPCEPCHVREVFATGQPQKTEKVNLLDGRTREFSAFPVRSESGQVILVAEHVRDITDRHLAEQALKESEDRFRTLIEDSPESLFLTDVQGTILAASRVEARRLGENLAKIIGVSAFDLFPPEVAARRRVMFEQAVATGRPVRLEDARGDRHFDIHFNPILNAEGKVSRLSVLGIDITDRKNAEQALKESEATLRTLIEANPESLFLLDTRGVILAASHVAAQRLGKSLEEIIGTDLHGMLPPEVSKKRFEIMQEVIATGQPARFEDVRGEFYFDSSITPIFDQDKVVQVAVLGVDITDRKNAEQALAESEERFRMLFEYAPDAYILADMQGEIIDCNQAAEKLAGYGREELVGNNFACLPWLDFRQQVRLADLLTQTARGEVMGPVDFTLTRQDGGEVIAEGLSLPLYIQGQNLVMTIIRDITARKQAEAELNKKHLELQETAQWLEQSRNMLQLIIESIPVRVFWKDRNLRYLGCNTPFARDAGFNRPEQLLGRDDFAMGWREQADLYRTDDLKVMESRRPKLNIVEPQTTPAGDKIWLSTNKVPLQMPNGEVFGVLGVYEDVTERQQAAEALAEQRELMDYVIRHDPNAIAVFDNELRYVFVSQRFLHDYGVREKDIIGKHHYEIFPEMPQRWKEVHQRVLAGAVERSDDDHFERPDGSITYNRWECRPWYRAGGRIGGIIMYTEVTTARKLVEEALRESEARYRVLFDASPDAITVMDLEMSFIMANRHGLEIWGIDSLDQAMSRQGMEYIMPEDRPRVMAAMQELLATGQTQTFSTTMLKPDGTKIPSLNSAALIRDAAGRPQAIIGIARDITALKQAEAELRQSEQRFRLMAETIQDVFWIATPRIGKTVYVSPGFEYIWGRTSEALYRHPKLYLETVHPEDRERVKSEIIAARKRSIPWSHEYRINRPDGTVRWIQNRGFPVRDKQGRVILFTGVATDITEHKALEGQLLQAQKMEAVGRLAGGVAHDFNNLLMAITGYGELMRAKVLKDDPLYGFLENILKAGERAAALTQQLLTFSRQKVIQPQVIDLNRVVLDLEPMLRRLIGEDLDLEVLTDRRPAAVKADPGQMGQIIMNLVVNARDAMPQGGRLTLKTAAVDLTEGCHSRFGLAPPGAYVMLEVADTGVGMDEATQAHVFEPFFTTKALGKGTGLGLSTVYGIVKQSGGYLDLASTPGTGSTFTIYLPRLEEIVEPPKVKIPITASFRGEETILLVEDEDMLRGLLAKFLRLYGYTVLEARHGGEALLACERHPGPIHLMVTDVVMPQMSGRELADRLTPLRPEMKMLYMSGYTEDALVQHGVADLSVAFLQKPFRPIELARRVHAVLHPPVSQ